MSQGADIAFPHLGITIGHLPKGITIGGFTIAFYGIIIACGMLAGLLLARWQAKRTGQEPDVYSDYAIWGIIFAIIGARLYYVAFSWDAYKNNLLQIVNTRGGGLASYGGVIAAVLTAFKLYAKIGKFAGAGSIVPITGFSNSIVSPAMEYKTEGVILGIGANMFKVAGPVLVYGICSSMIIGFIYWLIQLI